MSDETKMPDEVWVRPRSWLAYIDSRPPVATRYVKARPHPDAVGEAVGRLQYISDGFDASDSLSVGVSDLRSILDHLKQQEPADAD